MSELIVVLTLLILFSVPILLYYLFLNARYRQSAYFRQTRRPLLQLMQDKCAYGEYLIEKYLSRFSGEKRWLFNVYLPKDEGETTEIDAILIHNSGIYVFESKNYSGWIFGSEHQKMWTQSLPTGKRRTQKNHFLNPIWQNKLHIECLEKALSDCEAFPLYSFILFSDRCTLKKLTLSDTAPAVINRYDVLEKVSQQAKSTGQVCSLTQIEQLYQTLLPATQVSQSVKDRHIAAIQKRLGKVETSTCATLTSVTDSVGPAPVCPRCGALLTLRTVSKGERKGQTFWGCSRFPKCRYTDYRDEKEPAASKQ